MLQEKRKQRGTQPALPDKLEHKPKPNVTYTWLIAIGSIILFGSWVLENYLQKKYEAKNSESDYKRLLVISVRTNLILLGFETDNFRLQYLKDSTNGSIKNQLRNSLYLYCNMFCNQRKTIATILSIDEKKYSNDWLEGEFETDRSWRDRIKKESENGDLKLLNNTLFKLGQYSNEHTQSNFDEVNAFRSETLNNINTANNCFLVLYIIGSLCLGIAFIVRLKR